jgi:putative addiction module component (TIGR02574 family)
MSATQVLEQINKLPFEEQYQVFARLRDEFDPELTPEQVAELERRAAEARAHPERCRPLEDVMADIEKRYRAKK